MWYNLFSILKVLKQGWSIGNKAIHITITKERFTIHFDRLFKCPTGQLTGVTMKSINGVGVISNTKGMGNISYGQGHSLLLYVNADITNKTLQRLGWMLKGLINKPTCAPCSMGKIKQWKVTK